MAITQLYKRFTRLDSLIKYVMNGDKTDEMKFVSGINCLPETAFEEMNNTKNRFNKGKEKIIGYHLIQSFAKEDNVTPEKAHQIGLDYANEIFGRDFEIVVATHLNTENTHNHIVINSVSLKTGKKFYDNYCSRDYIRATSDFICQYYGLSTLDKPWKRKGYYKKFANENPYLQMIKRDADRCIEIAWSERDFNSRMAKLGYESIITDENGLIVYDDIRGRVVLLNKYFGDKYSYQEVKNRILYDRPVEPNYNADGKRYIANRETYEKMLEIRRTRELKKLPLLYLLFCLLLKIDPLPARMDFGNVRIPLTKEMKIELKYMNQLSRQAILLSKNRISSLHDLSNFRGKLEDEVRTLKGTRENLQRKKRKSVKQEDIDDFDKQLKELAPRIKSLNEDIQNLYMIERRTILLKKEADKAIVRERQRLEEIMRIKSKGKGKKYLR